MSEDQNDTVKVQLGQGDLKFDAVNLGQALGVLADIVASYVSSIQPPPGTSDETKKKLSQISISIFLHNLLIRSLHKEEMANILDIIALELREAAKPKESGDAETKSN